MSGQRFLAVTLAMCAIFVMFAADAALACPVCGTAKAENDWAFGVTTLLLSFLPPLMFAGGIWYLVRQHKKAARRDALHDGALPPSLTRPQFSTPD